MDVRNQDGEPDLSPVIAFYRDILDTLKPDAYPRAANALRRAKEMCSLLKRLGEVDSPFTWYCRTSHESLGFARETGGDSLVWILATGEGEAIAKAHGLSKSDSGTFTISYRVPDNESPWPGARMELLASSVTDALSALQVALARCG